MPSIEPPRTEIPDVGAFLAQPIILVDRAGLPEQYHQFDEPSAMAIRAALAARRPLLVRGKPGVGKTQLAAAAAKVLRRPIVSCVVDSRTESRDLLWEFDAVLRLADAQLLGAAPSILAPPPALCPETEAVAHDVVRSLQLRAKLAIENYIRPGPLWWAFHWDDAHRQATLSGTPIPHHDVDVDPANGCVVLIDEIDKAETDVPNGLLEALGSGTFTPVGRSRSVTIASHPPLVIITTNEERILPNAFLRRCLVLHLALPEKDQALTKFLVDRALVHFPSDADLAAGLFQKAAELFVKACNEAKKNLINPLPGQAEYLDLVRAALELGGRVERDPTRLLKSITRYVLKTKSDVES